MSHPFDSCRQPFEAKRLLWRGCDGNHRLCPSCSEQSRECLVCVASKPGPHREEAKAKLRQLERKALQEENDVEATVFVPPPRSSSGRIIKAVLPEHRQSEREAGSGSQSSSSGRAQSGLSMLTRSASRPQAVSRLAEQSERLASIPEQSSSAEQPARGLAAGRVMSLGPVRRQAMLPA